MTPYRHSQLRFTYGHSDKAMKILALLMTLFGVTQFDTLSISVNLHSLISDNDQLYNKLKKCK